MKIALINENSQRDKNNLIFSILKKVASKYNHEVFNYGVSKDKDYDLDYVKAGILAGILLNTQAVDFVITGCASGQGLMITCNKMPNVVCGYINDIIDIKLFMKINAGNAISIPFGKNFGVGMEYNLEQIFKFLFETKIGSGYPMSRKEIQKKQRKLLYHVENCSQKNLYDLLDELDKDVLKSIISNDYFEEHFFANSQDDEINEYLLGIIDS